MIWEHFEVAKTGTCEVFKKSTGEIIYCNYKLGVISTGKSRVFYGYQIEITNEKFSIFIAGKSKGYSETYSIALRDCNNKMEEAGLSLLVAGNSSDYSESAMSGGSGYGYIKGRKERIYIMSPLIAT